MEGKHLFVEVLVVDGGMGERGFVLIKTTREREGH